MKTLVASCVIVLMLLVFVPAPAEEAVLTLTPDGLITAGAETLTFTLTPAVSENLRMNVFAGEEAIAASVEVTRPGVAAVTLTRPLAEGETLRVFADMLADGEPAMAAEAEFTVAGRFGAKLLRLRARVDAMWNVWHDEWLTAYQSGEVWIRSPFGQMPFAAFPDEAPEMIVEEGEIARIWLSEPLPEGWSISAGVGMPTELTPCVPDEDTGAWTAAPGFDSVYLVSGQEAERIGITIVYERSNGFRASYPIVEWVQPDTDDPVAFNCYGFGTARDFAGGMYAVVGNGSAWYVEYDAQGLLSMYTELNTGMSWNNLQQSTGEPVPDGYVPPVVIW